MGAAFRRSTNQTGALGVSGSGRTLLDAIRVDCAAFDALPAPLRALVADQVVKLSAESVLRFYESIRRQARDDEGEAVSVTAQKLRDLEAAELNVFSGEHRGRWGYPLPHVAAGASICRAASGRSRRRRITGFGWRA